MYYAHLNNSCCVGISQLCESVEDNDLIAIKTYDVKLLGMIYDRVSEDFVFPISADTTLVAIAEILANLENTNSPQHTPELPSM